MVAELQSEHLGGREARNRRSDIAVRWGLLYQPEIAQVMLLKIGVKLGDFAKVAFFERSQQARVVTCVFGQEEDLRSVIKTQVVV